MSDEISCRVEQTHPDDPDEMYCEVDGEEKHVSDLTKDQCLSTDRGEWIKGYPRVQNWSGVTNPRKRRVIKHALGNGTNIVQSMSQQDDPLIEPSTAKHIQESYQPSVAGACRLGRDRSTTQPSSYDTDDTSRATETDTTDTFTDTSTDPDWTDDVPSEQELLEMNEDEFQSVEDVLSGI